MFIVLSSADEAGTCRVYGAVWGIAALSVSRVQVSGRSSRTGLSCHSHSLVTVIEDGETYVMDYSLVL